MTSAPAIGFEYRPSWLPRRVLPVVELLALFAILLSGMPILWKSALAIVVVAAGWRAMRQLAKSPVIAAGWDSVSGWTVHLDTKEDAAAVLVSHWVLGALVLLRLQWAGHGAHMLLLAPDNSDADIRRRLRMRLAALPADEPLRRA